MSKMLYVALFMILAVLLACSGPDATASPTAVTMTGDGGAVTGDAGDTSGSAPTDVLAEMPADEMTGTGTPAGTDIMTETETPTSTSMEDPTGTPVDVTGPMVPESEVLVPLDGVDLETFVSQLSVKELACVTEIGDPEQLLLLLDGPDAGSGSGSTEDIEAAQKLVPCLNNETLLRLFLIVLTGQTLSLSTETSACVREGFQDIDIAGLLTSGVGGGGMGMGEDMRMGNSMAALTVVLSCMNEDEQRDASSLGLGLDAAGWEKLRCVMDQLGGPRELVAAMRPEDGEPPEAYVNAAKGCGLEVGGFGQMPDGMDPSRLDLSGLSVDEMACVSEIGTPEQLVQVMSDPEKRIELVGCLDDRTLVDIFLKRFTHRNGELSGGTMSCIHEGFESVDLRGMVLGYSGEETAGGMAVNMIVMSCLNEDEWKLAVSGQDLHLQPDDYEGMRCMMEALGSPSGIVASLESDGEGSFTALMNAAEECGVEMSTYMGVGRDMGMGMEMSSRVTITCAVPEGGLTTSCRSEAEIVLP